MEPEAPKSTGNIDRESGDKMATTALSASVIEEGTTTLARTVSHYLVGQTLGGESGKIQEELTVGYVMCVLCSKGTLYSCPCHGLLNAVPLLFKCLDTDNVLEGKLGVTVACSYCNFKVDMCKQTCGKRKHLSTHTMVSVSFFFSKHK